MKVKNTLKQTIILKIKADSESNVIPPRAISNELQSLAKAMGVSASAAWRWYSNLSTPKGENFYKVPAYYGIEWQKFYKNR